MKSSAFAGQKALKRGAAPEWRGVTRSCVQKRKRSRKEKPRCERDVSKTSVTWSSRSSDLMTSADLLNGLRSTYIHMQWLWLNTWSSLFVCSVDLVLSSCLEHFVPSCSFRTGSGLEGSPQTGLVSCPENLKLSSSKDGRLPLRFWRESRWFSDIISC